MAVKHFSIAAVLAAATLVSSANLQPAREEPVLGSDKPAGCFSSIGELQLIQPQPDFNSRGKCNQICRELEKYVAGMYSDDCYCGDKYPPKSTLVDDEECNEPCPGINQEACGGLDTYSIYNTGQKVAVGSSEEKPSSSSSAPQSTNSPTGTSTNGPSPTAVPNETSAASAEPTEQPASGTNTVGIAVGVVVGVVVLVAVAGGVYYLMKRRRNEEIEEEHRRNAAVNAFISGSGKPPSSSGGLSMSDSRLDPVMANRRMSDGSIADNQDYSRRILRVTNA